MKLSAATLMAAEMRAFMAQENADLEWLEWCRVAVARGVRCDTKQAMCSVRRRLEVVPGFFVEHDRHEPEVK